MLFTSIFSFTHIVFYPSQNKFQFFRHIFFSSANAFNLDQSKILLFGRESCSSATNSLPHNPNFYQPRERSILKTSWEKEKMLVTSIFSFSHNLFYPTKDRNRHFSNTAFVVCKCFQFGQSQNFVVFKSISSPV